jgi:mannose-6-phosphate isomerase-like protein (cupin superfamily)
MDAFEISEVTASQQQSGEAYLEFLRVPTMSLGLYALSVGAVDQQQPHSEDEVYYIVSGRGQIRVEHEDREVQPGSIVFVPANIKHHFHSITEDLNILVFFAPAEDSGEEV